MDDIYFKLRYKYPDSVLIIRHNEYYRMYELDAIMINVIFNYKVNYGVVGFPIKSLDKIKKEFKNRSVNIVIYNDDLDIIEEKSEDNKYKKLSLEMLGEYVRILAIKEEMSKLENIIISNNNIEALKEFISKL